MQVYKTDKKLFWTNELKSWLWTFALAVLLFIGWKYFFVLTNDKIIVGIVVLLLLKLARTFTQYHVQEIKIDEQAKQLTVLLSSPMSGEKIMQYETGQLTSELINNSGFKKYLLSPFVLKIFLNPKDTFVITNRYGFTLDTLTSVDGAVKSMQA